MGGGGDDQESGCGAGHQNCLGSMKGQAGQEEEEEESGGVGWL